MPTSRQGCTFSLIISLSGMCCFSSNAEQKSFKKCVLNISNFPSVLFTKFMAILLYCAALYVCKTL